MSTGRAAVAVAVSGAPLIRMGRIAVHPDLPRPCEAAAPKRNCKPFKDHATYRIEKTNPETGEIWRKHLCTCAAAAWAARHHVPFPPGLWDRTESVPNGRPV